MTQNDSKLPQTMTTGNYNLYGIKVSKHRHPIIIYHLVTLKQSILSNGNRILLKRELKAQRFASLFDLFKTTSADVVDETTN